MEFVGETEDVSSIVSMCVQITALLYPPLELNFVYKGGTLEIPPLVQIDKVVKFCCLANTAIV